MSVAPLFVEATVLAELNSMLEDPAFITTDAYSPDSANYPDNRISFVDQHLRYLRTHKKVDPVQYLSNLRLMIRKG
jgi:hypothetical protein